MAREMKDSGFPWIGSIPKQWKVLPAQRGFTEVKRKNVDCAIQKALQFKFGQIIPKSNFDADSDDYVAGTITSYTIVEPGTIMINGLNLNYDFKTQRTGLVKEPGVITSAYLALWPDHSMITSEYATYLFKGYETRMALHNMGAGIRLTLGYKEFKKQPVLFPSIEEQVQITGFLDTECARIDAVIEQTRASIEEYKKLKQAIITQAVTKGIRPNRPMKKSGIKWIGEIPEEWTPTKFKYLAQVKSNLVEPEEYGDYPQVSPENIEKGSGRLFPCKTVSEVGVISGNHFFYKGQILYSKIRPKLNKITIAPFDGLCSADMYPIETPQNTQFLVYAMLSDVLLSQISMITEDRVKMPKINQDELGNTWFAKPPIDEQGEIVEFLNSKCNVIDHLVDTKLQLISDLESFKKTLIYEYVTGKKEVPA